jgi:hypothetical protein
MIIAGDDMTATRLDISIEQGAKFERNILVKNNNGTVKDLTGYSARMQIRPTFASDTVLLEATTTNGLISINSPGGVVTISLTADVTTTLDWSVAVYDLEIYSSVTEVIRILEGSASLSLEVTR